MKKLSIVIKASALAVVMAVVVAAPAFADIGACKDQNVKTGDLKSTQSDWAKCGGLKYNGEQVYAKTAQDCTKASSYVTNQEACKDGGDLNSIIKNIINAIIGVIGIIAVVMIILGGISYATSQGDPAKVKKGKDTIL